MLLCSWRVKRLRCFLDVLLPPERILHFPAGEKLVGAETLHSLIKYLKSRCEIRAFTFELSQQRYFNTTVNVLRTLEYSPGYSRHSRTSGNPFFYIFLDGRLQPHTWRSSDLFTLRLINHLNEEPTGGFEPLMAARGQRSLICAAESRH